MLFSIPSLGLELVPAEEVWFVVNEGNYTPEDLFQDADEFHGGNWEEALSHQANMMVVDGAITAREKGELEEALIAFVEDEIEDYAGAFND